MPRKEEGDEFDEFTMDGDETPKDEEEQQDDPFSDLDEDLKAKALEYGKALAQQEINQFKGSYGKRFNQLKKDLQEAGLDAADGTGKLVIGDPRRVAQFAGQFIPGALQSPGTTGGQAADEDEIPDQILDPKGYRDWLKQENQRNNSPVLEELRALKEAIIQTRMPDTLNQARGVLEAYGWEGLAENADFQKAYRAAMAQAAPGEMGDPETVETCALMAVSYVRKQNDGKLPKPQPRKENPYRESLDQTGRSRGEGGPRSGGFTEQELEGAKFLTNMYGREVSPAEYRALGEDAGGTSYRKVVQQREKAKR